MSARRLLPDDPEEWLNRARSNLLRSQAEIEGVYLEDLCFDAQQAAEKAIKSVLIHKRVRFPYIHDLGELLVLVESTGEEIPDSVLQAAKLTRFAVAMRYPGVIEPITREEYAEAVAIAGSVIDWAHKVLKAENQ
jgi:HEPN domain-containing protein